MWRVIDDLQANIVCYDNKHWQNLLHKSNQNGFRQTFDGGKTELRAIASHNKNKEARKFQEGGTAMLVYGDLIQQYYPLWNMPRRSGGSLSQGTSPFPRKHPSGFANVRCFGHYCSGMLVRYAIGVTCNARLGDVRSMHHSSYWSMTSSSGFRSARRSASIFESTENDIDSSILTNVLRWHRIGRMKQLNAKFLQS